MSDTERDVSGQRSHRSSKRKLVGIAPKVANFMENEEDQQKNEQPQPVAFDFNARPESSINVNGQEEDEAQVVIQGKKRKRARHKKREAAAKANAQMISGAAVQNPLNIHRTNAKNDLRKQITLRKKKQQEHA